MLKRKFNVYENKNIFNDGLAEDTIRVHF